jgi:hypothetical protein
MRTTITIEPDVASRLKSRMRAGGVTLKRAVNDALRAGLAAKERPAPKKRFAVKPQRGGIMPGIDVDKINQLLDELEVEEFARRFGR